MPFEKGKSGNPGGRPKEAPEVKALARKHGPEAINKLVKHMRGRDPRVAVMAAQAVLDRGFGKPHQSMDISSGDDDRRPAIELTDAELEERIRKGLATQAAQRARMKDEMTPEEWRLFEQREAEEMERLETSRPSAPQSLRSVPTRPAPPPLPPHLQKMFDEATPE
jgi:hypothetical protein